LRRQKPLERWELSVKFCAGWRNRKRPYSARRQQRHFLFMCFAILQGTELTCSVRLDVLYISSIHALASPRFQNASDWPATDVDTAEFNWLVRSAAT
jgi:hypothetical protein